MWIKKDKKKTMDDKTLLINKPELTDGPNIIQDMIQELKTP